MSRTIVIIDDVQQEAEQAFRAVRSADATADVLFFDQPLEAFETVKLLQPDLLIIDFMMPACDGITLLRWLRNLDILAPAILTMPSGVKLENTGRLVPKNNVIKCLQKPYDFDDIHQAILDGLLANTLIQ